MSETDKTKRSFFDGRNNIIFMSHEKYGYVEVGDDRHMNGMDAPATLDRIGAEWLILTLREYFKL